MDVDGAEADEVRTPLAVVVGLGLDGGLPPKKLIMT